MTTRAEQAILQPEASRITNVIEVHMKPFLIVAALLIGFSNTHAGTGIDLGKPSVLNPLKPGSALKSLLNSNRFDMHQTVGMDVGTGGSGFSQYYLNSLTYKASDKLTVNATLGLHNQAYGSGLYGSTTSGAQIVVPNVGITYQLKPNMTFHIGFSSAPNQYYRSSWNRW